MEKEFEEYIDSYKTIIHEYEKLAKDTEINLNLGNFTPLRVAHYYTEESKQILVKLIQHLSRFKRIIELKLENVKDCGFSNRVLNVFEDMGIRTIWDLVSFLTFDDIDGISGLGFKSRAEIKIKLSEYGIIYDHNFHDIFNVINICELPDFDKILVKYSTLKFEQTED